MAPVTFTTDLGTRDFYLAALKGAIISQCETVVPFIDISNHVKPFDIKEAAFIISNAYKYFPKGTIHVVHVNTNGGDGKLLLSVIDEHYFITFDNGILSIAFDKIPHEVYEVNAELLESHSLLFEDAIGKAINFLLKEYRPADFAHLTSITVNLRLMQPVTSSGVIRGAVVYIDDYGNAVTNISKRVFGEFIGERNCVIEMNQGDSVSVFKHYNEVVEGEIVSLFNQSGFLEIAINKGNAKKLLDIKVGSQVMVSVK